MTRRHDRSRISPVQQVLIFTRSAWIAAHTPMPTPRHARYETPRSAR